MRSQFEKYQAEIFFFFGEIYFQISSPDFGKPQKFHDFVFISPGFAELLEKNLKQASKLFQSKIFFFFGEIYFQISSPDFGKPQKFHFGERIWQASSFSHPQRFVGKNVLFKISFPQEMKSQTPNLHSSTNSSALISNFLSSSRSNQNIFHSSGWRMDFTFSRNSRDKRK